LEYWCQRVGVLVEVLLSEGLGTGIRGLRYWLRYCYQRVGVLVSEGWSTGIRGLGYWYQRVEVLVSEG